MVSPSVSPVRGASGRTLLASAADTASTNGPGFVVATYQDDVRDVPDCAGDKMAPGQDSAAASLCLCNLHHASGRKVS